MQILEYQYRWPIEHQQLGKYQ